MTSVDLTIYSSPKEPVTETAFHLGKFNVRLLPNAADIDGVLWDTRGAHNHPLKDIAFLKTLDRTYATRDRCYAEVRSNQRIVAQFILNQDMIDPTMFAPPRVKAAVRIIRRALPGFLRLRMVTVGTMDTIGAHWWHDPEAISIDELAALIRHSVKAMFSKAHLLVVRDLMDTDPTTEPLAQAFGRYALARVKGLPIAVIRPASDLPSHISRLNRKVRHFIRKMPQLANESGIRLEIITEFEQHIDECYALFLNVAQRATELQREEPVPLALFRELARLPGSRMTIARGPNDNIVGFILTRIVRGIACPAYVGLDYDVDNTVRLYHQLLWAEISTCLSANIAEIDLGLTSYFVKQGYGARLEPCTMLVRFQNNIMHSVLRPFIPILLHVEQPRTRS